MPQVVHNMFRRKHSRQDYRWWLYLGWVSGAALLLTLAVAVFTPHEGSRIIGQSTSAACSDAPAEPRDIKVWEHDRGLLVQWDACPDHTYEVRWRLTTESLPVYEDWPMTVNVGTKDEYDILGFDTDDDGEIENDERLDNGTRYLIQLRSIHRADNRIRRSQWVDDYFGTPERCADLPEIPTNVKMSAGESTLSISWRSCSGMRTHLRWRESTDRSWSNPVDAGTADAYVISDLENGVKYEVQLRSVLPTPARVRMPNGDPYRTAWSAAFPGVPTAVCTEGQAITPKEFVVVPGDEKLFVSWRPCPDHEYELRFRKSGDDWESWDDVGFDREVIRGLDNGDRYEVELRGRFGSNTSVATAPYATRPLAAPSDNRAPTWELGERRIEVVENQTYEEPIAVFEASDRDLSDYVVYEISARDKPDIFPFTINALTGELYLYDVLDYETADRYTITVQATDLAGESITRELVAVVVDSAGPAAPIITRACPTPSGVSVDWNRGSQYDYEFRRRPLDSNSDREVWIDTTVSTVVDLPQNTTWVFQVRAIDKASGEQSKWSSEVAVHVSNATNNRPQFREDEFFFEATEEQAAGLHIGYAIASDEDPYSSLHYRIFETTPEDAPFEINPISGTITTTGRLDFETVSQYELFIGATDPCGSRDYADVTITVIDDGEIDVVPEVPGAPSLITRHNQLIAVWPTDFEETYDLDWRLASGEYLSRPQDSDAAMPRLVDVQYAETEYAFRLRRVNAVGQAGDWSEETIARGVGEPPSVDPIVAPRQGQILGGAVPYFDTLTLKTGQTVYLGLDLFDIAGKLDNSLLDHRDVSIVWRVEAGDISNVKSRVLTYTAPDSEGQHSLEAVVKQTVPGGLVQFDVEIVVHVIGERGSVKPHRVATEDLPRSVVFEDTEYRPISNASAVEYRPSSSPKTIFKVREESAPPFEWVGVHIAPTAIPSEVADRITGYTPIGESFVADFVSARGEPIENMVFGNHVALCLPVPEDWTLALPSLEVMNVEPDGTSSVMVLPVRFQPDPLHNDPALVCGHATSFEGHSFIVISDDAPPTPTATPMVIPTVPTIPAESPTPTPTPVPTQIVLPLPSPTPIALPTNTPIPTLTSTPTAAATATLTATATLVPTATSTNTPVPSPTATPVPTDTPSPTAQPPTATPLPPEPTSTPKPTSTVVPSATLAPTLTATTVPVAIVEVVPTASNTPNPTPTPLPTASPESVAPPTEESGDEGQSSVIYIAIAILSIVGIAIAAFTIYATRTSSVDTSEVDELEVAPDIEELEAEVSEDGDADDADRYEVLRIEGASNKNPD